MDLRIDNNEDLLFVDGDLSFVKGAVAIAQHVRMRLATWLGESPYDVAAGVPYRTIIFQPGTSDDAIIFILEQVVLKTPGVTGVELRFTKDTETREMTVTGTAQSIDGPIDFTTVITAP